MSDAEAKPTTFQTWYNKPENRESLKKRRRDRYATDPEAREKQKKWTAEYKKRKKKEAATRSN